MARQHNRERIASVVRTAIYHRDGFACLWCGSEDQLTLDHIICFASGGSNDSTNLITACYNCNHDRGNMFIEFYALRSGNFNKIAQRTILAKIARHLSRPLDIAAAQEILTNRK